MNVLVIAPHPDDETIGCGGSLCAHAQRGDHLGVVFLTSGELGLKHLPVQEARAVREAEAKQAGRILGINDLFFLRCGDWMLNENIIETAHLLRPVLEQQTPQLIYLPHPGDNHPDHKVSLAILRAALQPAKLEPELRGYEVWTPLTEFDHVEDISQFMGRKRRALRAHKSQLQEFDYLRAVTGLNQYRGGLAAKARYAEVFQTIAPPQL